MVDEFVPKKYEIKIRFLLVFCFEAEFLHRSKSLQREE
jgi:hypothetical protein